MNKRILISEEEKKRILNSHKKAIKEERTSFEFGNSKDKEFLVSESNLTKLIGKALNEGQRLGSELIKEASERECNPACTGNLMCINGKCQASAIKEPKRSIKFRDMQEAGKRDSCRNDSDCGGSQRCVGKQCTTTTTKENRTEVKELEGCFNPTCSCKSNKECPKGKKCINGKCTPTTTTKEERVYEIEFNEVDGERKRKLGHFIDRLFGRNKVSFEESYDEMNEEDGERKRKLGHLWDRLWGKTSKVSFEESYDEMDEGIIDDLRKLKDKFISRGKPY